MKEPEKPRGERSQGGLPQRAPTDVRDGILRQIFSDMMSLSSTGPGATSVTSPEALTDDVGRDDLWRAHLKQRVESLREKLVGTRVGSYQVLEEIAAGGMGIVFKARQESPMFTRETALKILLAGPDARSDDRERFVAEAKGLASLSHPSLVHIFDSGIEGDLYYFSMELVDGWSLDDTERVGALPLIRRVEIVRDIARALTYLHARGVIHRDVKPANVMIDREGRAKLLDFGIAQFSSDPRRRAIQAGTPHFMSPEVIDPHGGFGPIGPATDVYALGAVLYQLAVGRPVFEGSDVGEVLARTLRDVPQFPRARRERLPADLQALITRALRKRVSERHASAALFAEGLDAFLRRDRLKLPVAVSVALIAAALVFVAVVMRDTNAPATAVEPRLDLTAWQERVHEIEEVDASGATPLVEILHRLEQAPDSNHGAALISELANARNAFWRDRTQAALTEAQRAKESFLGLPVRTDARLEKLFSDGSRGLELGRMRKADKTAHELLRSAAASFEEGRHVAQAQQAVLELERKKAEAASSRERAAQARRELEEDGDWLDPEIDPSTREARESSMRKLEDGDRLLSASELERANALFAESFEGFVRTRVLGRAARDVERTSLRAAVESAELESSRSLARLKKNLPTDVLLELERLREAAREAAHAERLKDLRQLVREHGSRWKEALQKIDRAERAALEARSRAQAISIERRLPAPLKDEMLRAREALQEGESKLKSEELTAARAAFERAASKLQEVRDETARLTEGMVWVAGILGGAVDGSGETPGFWIDRTEVTVREFARFGRYLPAAWAEQSKHAQMPVVGVSLEAASAFALSRGKELPSEAQWKLACAHERGGPASAYPFGSAFEEKRVNGAGAVDGFQGLAPARSLESGASTWGCLHLSGNAAEWVRTGREEGVLMGGSYLTEEPVFLRSDSRYVVRSEFKTDSSAQRTAGFRCVLRSIPEERRP